MNSVSLLCATAMRDTSGMQRLSVIRRLTIAPRPILIVFFPPSRTCCARSIHLLRQLRNLNV